jgi:hypothetical protein
VSGEGFGLSQRQGHCAYLQLKRREPERGRENENVQSEIQDDKSYMFKSPEPSLFQPASDYSSYINEVL